MNIYCDESGYTGADLLANDQPYFVYSAVSFNSVQLEEIKKYIYSEYPIQNEEIKGKLLVKNKRGKKVIKHIFEQYADSARIVYHDKKYALSAKIIEYGVEPNLKSNYIFYDSHLNKFLATGIYASFVTKDPTSEKLFTEFLQILRGKSPISETTFNELSSEDPLIKWVLDIATKNPDKVIDEITRTDSAIEKWILDLTMTSLLGLLSDWGKTGRKLTVMCDNSKVFIDNPVFEGLNSMGLIGNRKKILDTPLGFKLSEKISHKDSKDFFGLQIADLFSSTTYYCLMNHKEPFSKEILSIIWDKCICKPNSFCIHPEWEASKDEFASKLDFYYRFMDIIYKDVMFGLK